MIIRTWRAITDTQKKAEYIGFVKELVIPYFNKSEGYLGCKFSKNIKSTESRIEILVITFWESLEAVTAFSGSTDAQAFIPEEIAQTLLSYDSHSEHFETFIDD